MIDVRFSIPGMSDLLAGQREMKELLMAVREDIAAVAEQLAKAHDEIVAKIEEGTVTAEDIAPLKAAAQALDDIVPDVPNPGEPPAPTSPLA